MLAIERRIVPQVAMVRARALLRARSAIAAGTQKRRPSGVRARRRMFDATFMKRCWRQPTRSPVPRRERGDGA
jgi:hypothetical protein